MVDHLVKSSVAPTTQLDRIPDEVFVWQRGSQSRRLLSRCTRLEQFLRWGRKRRIRLSLFQLPRKRMRARKIILDSDDEVNGEDKDVEGGVSPPIRVGRTPKRLRRRSKAVVSDSEGDTTSFTLGPSEARRDKFPGRLVSSPTSCSNRVTKASRSYIGRQDADAEDDYNKTLDPQDVTIFEDNPYAEEQTDEEEYESDLEMEEQRINQGHHTAKPKTTSRSKRPGTGKPRKPNRPRSTSIPFCLQDTSKQRRSPWASRLYARLKSYRDQCRDTYQRLGDYEETMESLSNSQGPLAKTVASILLRRNLDVEKVKPSQWRRFFNYHDFLMKMYTPPGVYVKLIDVDDWQHDLGCHQRRLTHEQWALFGSKKHMADAAILARQYAKLVAEKERKKSTKPEGVKQVENSNEDDGSSTASPATSENPTETTTNSEWPPVEQLDWAGFTNWLFRCKQADKKFGKETLPVLEQATRPTPNHDSNPTQGMGASSRIR
ncbi:hypothetical protein DM02DRAFT_661014 [Periconia macrospinosa]|uniref:Uncharacterized protein n=1 Tax=Periconia macrospinosa TaxID=97972 RepID=A0A2V1D8L5_9PLEO|nr:hypothetical protein DM02DRAFT_661014 [Periconia macrospinosa]